MVQDREALKRELLSILKPGESIPAALRRLGGSKQGGCMVTVMLMIFSLRYIGSTNEGLEERRSGAAGSGSGAVVEIDRYSRRPHRFGVH